MLEHTQKMRVTKRNGELQKISFDKILYRIENLSEGIDIDPTIIAQRVIARIYDGIKTSELDELSAEICEDLKDENLNYGILASRIIVSNNHKNTSPSFSETISILYNHYDKFGNHNPVISKKAYDLVMANKEKLNSVINYDRDFNFSYFGFKTLENAYLLKANDQVVERVQHLLMRVSLGMNIGENGSVKDAIRSYDLMSQGYFIHATPTLYNSATYKNQLSSCFLLGTKDSLDSIFKTIGDCAMISKGAGGIGLHMSCIRSKGSYIKGTNGKTNGILPMLRVYNETARYVNQGGRRPGSFAMYIEPHHPEIMSFLELKKNHGNQDERARDLFLAMWISDLFMERVRDNAEWSLFDDKSAPGLLDAYGNDFKELYERYEKEGKAVDKIQAREIWDAIYDSWIETGTPYMLFKDAVNKKSNQMNVGTIKSSNLCVSGDTKILTSEGYHIIRDLVDETVEVWNGEEFSETVVRKTGENQDMMKVSFSNGVELKCTPYHKFYIVSNDLDKKFDVVEAKNLRKDTRIIHCEYPVIENGSDKYDDVPVNCNLDIKMQWLQKYVDKSGKYGIIRSDGSRHNLYFVDNNKDYLVKVVLMLQTMGVDSIVQNHSDTEFRLTISPYYLNKLYELGLKTEEIKKSNAKVLCNRVLNVEYLDEKEDTYCFTERKLGRGIFNGVLTGQCAEIVEYSDDKEYAVCTLASVGLPKYVREDGSFDYDMLVEVMDVIVNNLNKVIDINYYPVPETRVSNMRHRPMGIGVQGLADVFAMMKIPFESEEARDVNRKIFETMYYGAMLASNKIAMREGPYETFKGSPLSEGKFQFDLWGVKPSDRHDWESLRASIMEHGVRNSLCIALMPTASTSQILGNNECFEPYTSNYYTRTVSAGDFTVINKHMVKDLEAEGLWTKDIRDKIVFYNGSIQQIEEIPERIRELYKTVWEMKQKSLMQLSLDRAPFVDQTQSFNYWSEEPTKKEMTSAMFFAWKSGAKTGCYYVRTRPKVQAQQFSLDASKFGRNNKPKPEENKYEVCEMCSS